MSKRIAMIATSVFLVVCAGAHVFAAASWQARFQAAQINVANAERTVADWSLQAKFGLFLLVLTVMAGTLTAILQAIDKPWKKITTVVLGALVTAAAVIGTSALDGDFKTMNGRSKIGLSHVVTARHWVNYATSATSDEDRALALEEVEKALGRYALIATKTGVTLPSIVTEVHARENCGCLKEREPEPGFKYFCGVGNGKTLSAARSDASDRAVESALHTLTPKTGAAATKDLSAYLRRVSTQVDSCLDEKSRSPNFSIMIRIPEALADSQSQTAFITEQTGTLLVANAHGQVRVPSGARTPIDVKVRATPESSGSFVVSLVPSGRGSSSYIVQKVQVIADGSSGSTKWTFAFFSNTTEVARLAARSYKDGTNGVITFAPAESPLVTLPPTSVYLTIQGFRR